VGEPKALRPPDLEVARTPAHLLDVLIQNSISNNGLSHSRTESTMVASPDRWSCNISHAIKTNSRANDESGAIRSDSAAIYMKPSAQQARGAQVSRCRLGSGINSRAAFASAAAVRAPRAHRPVLVPRHLSRLFRGCSRVFFSQHAWQLNGKHERPAKTRQPI
jgi:hypothetical protein